jgi:hypothetical protein
VNAGRRGRHQGSNGHTATCCRTFRPSYPFGHAGACAVVAGQNGSTLVVQVLQARWVGGVVDSCIRESGTQPRAAPPTVVSVNCCAASTVCRQHLRLHHRSSKLMVASMTRTAHSRCRQSLVLMLAQFTCTLLSTTAGTTTVRPPVFRLCKFSQRKQFMWDLSIADGPPGSLNKCQSTEYASVISPV